jgi:2-dehydro-3-deoxyphosphogluconate aldolase/(4S)-4-hydroxy-2-oxoglutarate aldolase
MGGLNTLKSIAGPFCAQVPDLRFIPTGGITADNINKYRAFSPVLACGGSWMVPPNLIKEGNFGTITELTKGALESVAPKQD